MSVFLSGVLLFGLFVAVWYLVSLKKQRQLDSKATVIAQVISEKGRLALFAYQNYELSDQPRFIADELLAKGLIEKCSGSGRFGITRLGKAVGLSLNLYDEPSTVITID